MVVLARPWDGLIQSSPPSCPSLGVTHVMTTPDSQGDHPQRETHASNPLSQASSPFISQSHHRPWQMDWKRPKWEQPQPDGDHPSTPMDRRGTVVHHSAAQVRRNEIPAAWAAEPTEARVDVTSSGQEDTCDRPGDHNDASTWLLTATLLSSAPLSPPLQGSQPRGSGDVILLELVEDPGLAAVDDTPSSSMVLQRTRRLQWPATFSHGTDRTVTPAVSATSSGLAAICLCRPPQDDPLQKQLEAAELLQWLDWGASHGIEGSSLRNEEEEEEEEEERQQLEVKRRPKGPDHAPEPPTRFSSTRLLLACLTVHGQVYLYDACQLLESAKSSSYSHPEPLAPGVDLWQHSIESLLLGRELLQSLQEQIWPLCQPLRTISLSLSWRKQDRSNRTNDRLDATKEQDEAQVDTLAAAVDAASSQQPVSVWDPNLWDSTTDAASLPFLTKYNRPTDCITAFSYLVISGRGHRKRRRRRIFPFPSTTAAGPHTYSVASETEPSIASRTTMDTRRLTQRYDDGGFITLVSLYTFSQVRTVYLPFAPRSVAPMVWRGMELLVVLGWNEKEALAMRLDPTNVGSVVGPVGCAETGRTPEDRPPTSNPEKASKSQVAPIERFQIVPIRLPDAQDLTPLVVPPLTPTAPPALAMVFTEEHEGHISVVQRTFRSLEVVRRDEFGSMYDSYFVQGAADSDFLLVISTRQEDAHVAHMTLPTDISLDASSVMCCLGQGWCMVGVSVCRYMICWDGATAVQGAFIEQLPIQHGTVIDAMTKAVAVLPASATEQSLLELQEDCHYPPDLFVNRDRDTAKVVGDGATSDPDEDFVVTAIRNVLESEHQDGPLANTITTPSLKSKLLLRKLTSWTKLEPERRLRYIRQVPIISLFVCGQKSHSILLSVRHASIHEGPAASFQHVLEWLTSKRDFLSAASVALDLLQDAVSLRQLWRSFGKIEDDDNLAKLAGLLDGIRPLSAHDSSSVSTLTHLSDMTISLLVHGGQTCSATLETFLTRNVHYDAARACMMLAAATASTMAEFAGGSHLERNSLHYSESAIENLLWPLRCLLQIARTRSMFSTAIALLNAVVPDELRHRRRDTAKDYEPLPMAVFLSIIKSIISSSPGAIELLFSLTEEETGASYWQSLDHETQLALSTLPLDDTYVTLFHIEVRSWVLKELNKLLEDQRVAPPLSSFEWIQELAMACIANGGCDKNILMGSKCSTFWDDSGDGFLSLKQMTQRTRESLCARSECCDIDLDMLIPALFLLQRREAVETDVPIQIIINAACFLARHQPNDERRLPTNLQTLARQCTIAHNLQAGAHLIGGEYGLILACCDLLMVHCGLDLEKAEEFLLVDPFQQPETLPAAKKFEPCEPAYQLLYLLDQHVLSVRTYGDFNDSFARGKVDPVFAAKLCLRTWWCMTQSDLDHATPWLTKWLRLQLQLESGKPSPFRLSCAALVRALLWPSEEGRDRISEPVLASLLHLPASFTVLLTQSCCGLFEALPESRIEDCANESYRQQDFSFVSAATDHPQDVMDDHSMNESFVSAVSSIEAEEW